MGWHVVLMAKTAHIAMLAKLPKLIGTGKENFVPVHSETGSGRRCFPAVSRFVKGFPCSSPAAAEQEKLSRLLPAPNTARLPKKEAAA
eukprot:2734359-Prymnesium_polylepis.2